MKYHALDFLACPSCKHFPLKITSTLDTIEDFESNEQFYRCDHYCGNGNIDLTNIGLNHFDCNACAKKTVIEGFLICEKCGVIFLIRNGIPKIINDELKSDQELQIVHEFSEIIKSGHIIKEDSPDSFELTAKKGEMSARAQYDEIEIIESLTSDSHQFLKKIEYDCIMQSIDINDGHILLDCGAGYGILSIPLSKKCRFIVATDLTYETLVAFKEYIFKINTEYFHGLSRFPEEKICLIQADSCNLPFRTGFQFDRVISIEVISHIPGSEARKKALHEIYEYISKNGVFLLTVSNDYLIHKVMRKIRGIPREQLISGGKGVGYINKFQKRELMELLDNLFIVERFYGCQSSLGLISRISKKLSYSVEKLIQNSPLSLIMGKMIFVSCKRR